AARPARGRRHRPPAQPPASAAPPDPAPQLTAPAVPEAPQAPPQGVTAESLPLPAGPDRPDAPQRDAPVETEVAAPRDLDRVAPTPVAPSPLVAEAPEATPDTRPAPDAAAEAPPAPEAPAAAPREATTQIVTEADDTSEESLAAPVASALPVGRPDAPPPAPQPDPEPPQDQSIAAVETETTPAPAAPAPAPSAPTGGAAAQGPAIPTGAIEGVRTRLSNAWNVSILSSLPNYEELVVTLSLPMGRDGKPAGRPSLISPSPRPSDPRWTRAIQFAERALMRAAGRGFDLPAESYGRWQTIEVTFNPRRGLQVGGGT
ncbi:MAG: hypothetical protein AAF192_16850, partial [Pseudomonadota bacterium]